MTDSQATTDTYVSSPSLDRQRWIMRIVSMGWDGQEGSAKKTEIEEDFEIAVHDETHGQWEAVMGNSFSHFSRKGDERNVVLDISDEELKLFPAEMVSWDDTQEFLKKLSALEHGRGYEYRLPTEAEWEYACRGGATHLEECSYHFYLQKPTNDLSSEQANFNGKSPAGNAPKGRALGRPTRVGAYPPNKLGHGDMHGNVWQWCAPSSGSAGVPSGGSWFSAATSCQAAFRLTKTPKFRINNNGSRLVRVPGRH